MHIRASPPDQAGIGGMEEMNKAVIKQILFNL